MVLHTHTHTHTYTLVCVYCEGSIGIWTQGFAVSTRHFATWAMPSAHLALVTFSDRVSHFSQTGLSPWYPYLYFPYVWDYRHLTSYPPCLLKWGLTNLFPGLPLNRNLPDVPIWSVWDYNNKPPCPLWFHSFLFYFFPFLLYYCIKVHCDI
jgi:hypothetical protein